MFGPASRPSPCDACVAPTLASALARHHALPLICKDTIKEPLFDVIGAADRADSRRLSDASFAVMFALAHDCGCP
jgi:predicted kinase